jgi:hypothetical protein
MNYESQLQNLIGSLENDSGPIDDWRISKGRKYDYIEKKLFGNWQRVAAVVKSEDSKVCNGFIRTRKGDIVELQGNTPKRGSKFVKGTVFTEDPSEFFNNSKLRSFAPSWFNSEYKERTPNSRR